MSEQKEEPMARFEGVNHPIPQETAADLQAEIDRKEELLQKWQFGYQRLRDQYQQRGKTIQGLAADLHGMKATMAAFKRDTRKVISTPTVFQAEIDQYQSALTYYADFMNYEMRDDAHGVPVNLDGGKRAREALESARIIDRAINIAGLQARIEGQKQEIARLQEHIKKLKGASADDKLHGEDAH